MLRQSIMEYEMKAAELKTLMEVLEFSAHKHKNQRRKDAEASPYINHPIALANILVNEGHVTDLETICAALLHDTIEDTETTEAELRAAFGPSIAGIVAEVSDDQKLEKHQRKQAQIDHAPHLTAKAKAVKLADKIANLRDVAACPPPSWPLERRQAYFDWAKQVIDGLRGSHPELEAVFDEQYAKRP
jgi:guanosine-3',5'-bis(diphosphate) 3'-pyrophosphohydrolase